MNSSRSVVQASAFAVFALLVAPVSGGDRPNTVEVLIAKRDLNVHEKLREPEKLFTRARYRAGEEPVDAITSFAGLDGCVLRHSVRKGFPLTQDNLYKRADVEIPPGFQAIGVRVSVKNLPAKYARLCGSRVDLVLIVKNQEGVRRIVLLKDALVLDVDPCTAGEEPQFKKTQTIIIFALKRTDLLKVNVVMDMGELRVIVAERMESHDRFDAK